MKRAPGFTEVRCVLNLGCLCYKSRWPLAGGRKQAAEAHAIEFLVWDTNLFPKMGNVWRVKSDHGGAELIFSGGLKLAGRVFTSSNLDLYVFRVSL